MFTALLAPLLTTSLTSQLVIGAARADEVREQIDWQAHPAMHIPWRVYGPGLTDARPELTYKHALTQTMHTPYLDASGVRILMAGAMAAEKAKNPAQARALILEQLAYVEDFVAANPERYVLARTPDQARDALSTTDKMVVIHSIEGGRMILTEPDDAEFWAEQGVALITVTHLLDDELGGAASNAGLLGWLLNPAAARKRRRGKDRGLTERGREVIVELDRAGILVDLTHMSPQAIDETLAITAASGIPPVVTHGKLSAIQDVERAFTDAQVVAIYQQGGVFNLAVSGDALHASDNTVPEPPGYCPGTLDGFRWHYETLQDILDDNIDALFGVQGRASLTEAQRTALATGWASDWNGGIGHSLPKYGRGRCEPLANLPAPALDLDTLGLAHPGLLPQYWRRLSEAGMDLDPMLRSAERFLQLWERALTPVAEREETL